MVSLIQSTVARIIHEGARCGWHDLAHHHGSSGGPELDQVATVFLITAVGIVFVGSFVGVVGGSLVVTLTRKARHLFWAVPAANVLIYGVAVLVRPYPGGISAQFRMPGLAYTVIEILLLILQSLVLACLVAAVYLGVRAVRSRMRPKPSGQVGKAQGDIQAGWQRYLDAPRVVTRWAAFQEGFSAPRYGFAYICENRQLWPYAIIPIVLNVFITTLVFVLLLLMASAFIVHLHPLFPTGWAWAVLEVLCAIALLALALLITLVAWTLLQGLLCGHFYGKLAREVELRLGTPAEALKELPLYREVADTVLDTASLMTLNIGLLLLHIIPGLGSICGIAGSLYFDCYLLGREYLDIPLSLRGKPRRERQTFARQFRGQTLGLGAAALLMTFVPIIGSVALTAAAVGSVLLCRRLGPAETCPEATTKGK